MKDTCTRPSAWSTSRTSRNSKASPRPPRACASAPLVTIDELANNADVRNEYPSSRHDAVGAASPARRSATWGRSGGDLCQRPRCWYYRTGFGLLAMKDGKSLVPDGENSTTPSSAAARPTSSAPPASARR